MNSPPASATWPRLSSRRNVRQRPPTRSRASRTVTSQPLRSSSNAAVSPARPAPTTTTRPGLRRPLSPPQPDRGTPAPRASAAPAAPATIWRRVMPRESLTRDSLTRAGSELGEYSGLGGGELGGAEHALVAQLAQRAQALDGVVVAGRRTRPLGRSRPLSPPHDLLGDQAGPAVAPRASPGQHERQRREPHRDEQRAEEDAGELRAARVRTVGLQAGHQRHDAGDDEQGRPAHEKRTRLPGVLGGPRPAAPHREHGYADEAQDEPDGQQQRLCGGSLGALARRHVGPARSAGAGVHQLPQRVFEPDQRGQEKREAEDRLDP